MKQVKTIFSYIWSPKTIVFALALYNFISLWFASNVFIGIACFACSWYFDWSYTNDPSILLLAASFLLINKFWSYLGAVLLSGFIFFKCVYLINNFGWIEWLESLSRQWRSSQEFGTDILTMWEIQLVLAFTVFSIAIFYIIRNHINRNTLQ